MYKNVASQKVAVFAKDLVADEGKTGDAANITAEISLDGGASAATNDANPTELDATDHPGVYVFDLTQAETNADMIVITPVSATANIALEPRSLILFTQTVMRGTDAANTTVPDAAGTAAALHATTDAALAVVDGNVDSILTDTNELQTDWHDGGRLDLILDAAGGAGDPWITALPGAYGAGTAGKIIGDNINAPISTVDTVVDGIKAVTDALPDAGALSDLATILADTNELQTDDVPGLIAALNNLSAADVNAEVDTALSDYDPPTKAEMDTAHGLLATEAKQDIIDTVVDAIKVVTDAQASDGSGLTALGDARIAELAAANLPADVDTLLTRVTASVALASVCTEARLSELDAGTAGKAAAQIDDLVTALVNKMIITKANGNVEQFTDADVSIGTIAGAFTSDATTVTRLRMEI